MALSSFSGEGRKEIDVHKMPLHERTRSGTAHGGITMASRQRQWTGYPGVYFVEKLQKKGGGKERVYYVVYRKGGRQVE